MVGGAAPNNPAGNNPPGNGEVAQDVVMSDGEAPEIREIPQDAPPPLG